ncbi:MAG: hypothetical protein M3R17_20695, partial [Bacteroidota bacterium]|nr:hypothetical protein [Bacteroidota bacterium]
FIDFSFVVLAIGIVLMTVGLMLFLSIRGVLIDVEQNRIKPYVIFFARIGSWQPLTYYNKIVLSYVNESRTMNARAGTVTMSTKGFDIFLKADDKSKLRIKELTDYSEAKAFLTKYAKKLNIMEVNSYEQMKEQLQKRRLQERR